MDLKRREMLLVGTGMAAATAPGMSEGAGTPLAAESSKPTAAMAKGAENLQEPSAIVISGEGVRRASWPSGRLGGTRIERGWYGDRTL